jgi:uncharacterized membrane protein
MRYNSTRLLSTAIVAVALLALAFASCSRKPEYPAAPASGEAIKFSISKLAEGKPAFHSLEHEGTRIDYFVLKVNGTVESYFDACAKCYPKKMGYRAEGQELVCVACGQRFPVKGLKGIGSCYPLPLKGTTEGDTYAIDRKELIRGAKYF